MTQTRAAEGTMGAGVRQRVHKRHLVNLNVMSHENYPAVSGVVEIDEKFLGGKPRREKA